MPRSLPDLERRLSKAIERGKGLRLEAADLDLLCAAGVIELVAQAAAAEQRRVSEARVEARAHRQPAGRGTSAEQAIAHLERMAGKRPRRAGRTGGGG